MAKTRRTSAPVKHPLAPTIMTELGGLTAAPPPSDGFDPASDWAACYRIWTCYGHSNRGNQNMGFLRIARKVDGDAQRLTIRQMVRNSEGKLHTIRANVRCKADAIASPETWTLSSAFTGRHADGLPRVDLEETGRVRGNTLETRSRGTVHRQKIEQPLTADWCLFEAVQRMSCRDGPPRSFHVLEGLSVLKKDHSLKYRGKRTVRWGPETLSLHRFDQVGRGVYPYEYWLDDRARLLLVTTGPRAYVLDPQAEKVVPSEASGAPGSRRGGRRGKEAAR